MPSSLSGSLNGGSRGQEFGRGALSGPSISTSNSGIRGPSGTLPIGPGGQLSNNMGSASSGLGSPPGFIAAGINGGPRQNPGFGGGFGGQQLSSGVPSTALGNGAGSNGNLLGANGAQLSSGSLTGPLQPSQSTGFQSSGGGGVLSSNTAGFGGGSGGQLNNGAPGTGLGNGAGLSRNFIGGTGAQTGSGSLNGALQLSQSTVFLPSGGAGVPASNTGGFGGGYGGQPNVAAPGAGSGGSSNRITGIRIGPQITTGGGNVPVGSAPGLQVPSTTSGMVGPTQVLQPSSPPTTTKKPASTHKKRKHKRRHRGRIVIECFAGTCKRVQR